MKIGVIQTGKVRGDLAAAFGEYPDMFERLLNAEGPRFALETHAVVDGAPLPAPEAAAGWVVTGSRHGVYDDLPWIEPLKAFLRAARGAGRPIVGVCFGHQILAEALGGRAVKHDGGWRLGAHRFAVTRADWIAGHAPTAVDLHSVHQDQVVAIPDDATVWATADGCRYAGLTYGDPAAPDAVSIQPHPEFVEPFARALVEKLRDDGRVEDAVAAPALASFGGPVSNATVGRMLGDYLARAAAARAAA
jgi:GMP synthase-like glutamine amidotransferase